MLSGNLFKNEGLAIDSLGLAMDSLPNEDFLVLLLGLSSLVARLLCEYAQSLSSLNVIIDILLDNL